MRLDIVDLLAKNVHKETVATVGVFENDLNEFVNLTSGKAAAKRAAIFKPKPKISALEAEMGP